MATACMCISVTGPEHCVDLSFTGNIWLLTYMVYQGLSVFVSWKTYDSKFSLLITFTSIVKRSVLY